MENKVMELVEVMLVKDEKIEYKEMLEKLEKVYNENMHKSYDKFYIVLGDDKTLGKTVSFKGERLETEEETAQREAEEKARQKKIAEAELKEYLRLKKKYGKKDEEG